MQLPDERSGTVSEPKLFRKSTLHIKKKGSKKGSANFSATSSEAIVEVIDKSDPDLSSPGNRKCSGDTSLSEGSERDDDRPKHRLQRQKAQSRKTFRFRKSRRGAGFLHDKDNESETKTEGESSSPHKKRQYSNDEESIAFIVRDKSSRKAEERASSDEEEFENEKDLLLNEVKNGQTNITNVSISVSDTCDS